ncbi:hypothetical protein D3C80_2011190 [compost metagenome]
MNVLTVQVHAGFNPQGIPRPQADGGNTRADQIVEKTRSLIGRHDDFQTVFAGVTRTCDVPVTLWLAFKRLE